MYVGSLHYPNLIECTLKTGNKLPIVDLWRYLVVPSLLDTSLEMPTDNHTKSKKAYLVSLKHKLKKHLQLQSASVTQVDRRWLNGFMAAGFHSGLILK